MLLRNTESGLIPRRHHMNSIYRHVRHSGMAAIAFTVFALLPGAAHLAQAQNPLKTIDNPEGGKIVYGQVDGANSQAAAMGAVLRTVHNQCGDKPQVGKIFQVRGTNSVAVFFTAVRRAQGDNKRVAGMVISTQSAPNHVEAALVTDDAARFGSTVNPMLRQLFSVWHPAGAAATANPPAAKSSPAAPASSASSAPAGNGHSGPAAHLHTVTAPDNSASIGIADGWQLDPHSASSTMVLIGPNGELAVYGANKPAVDPNNPQQVNAVRYGIYKGSGTMLYPYHQDLGKAYPELLQAWRRANNASPVKLQVDKIEPMNPPKGGGICVLVTGHIDADGQGMKKLIDDICQFPPAQWGAYSITRNFEIMTDVQFEREQNTVMAMFMSAKINQQVMNQQMQEKLAQKQKSDQQWRDWGQRESNRIRAQGEAAQKSFADRQAANDAQHAGYWAQQDSNARNSQGFSNYLLDQTVIQDNNMYGNGTVGHGTAWNSTADALVKSNPDRYEIVQSPNFWKGVDY
jgi:hypothetical protein